MYPGHRMSSTNGPMSYDVSRIYALFYLSSNSIISLSSGPFPGEGRHLRKIIVIRRGVRLAMIPIIILGSLRRPGQSEVHSTANHLVPIAMWQRERSLETAPTAGNPIQSLTGKAALQVAEIP